MSSLKYLAGLVVPALTLVSLLLGGWWSFLAVGFVFGVFPLLELLLPGTERNPTPEQERALLTSRGYDLVLYLTVPVQYGLLALFLWTLQQPLEPHEWVGAVLAMGMSCGVLGINVAHELGHRKPLHERWMAFLLLLTTLYCHFTIEHNRGHHARVATEDDHASARYGEWLYVFLPRAIVCGYLDAWRLERQRLARQGRGPLTWRNEMIRLTLAELAFVALVVHLAGPVAALGFACASLVGVLLLETVNYIEHYGLIRRRKATGIYERTLPIHSWNSNHTLGRLMLFELTRHSDHHADARRPYQVLRHFDESPQLPTGYPGMVALAWCPPLFLWVMHRHIARQQARIAAIGGRTDFAPGQAA